MGNSTGSIFRTFLMMPIAAVVTAGLFLTMAGMIEAEERTYDEMQETPPIDIFRTKRPPTPLPDLSPPDIPDQPKPPVPETEWPTIDPTPGDGALPTKPVLGPTGPVGPIGGGLSGVLISIPPDYPQSCLARGTEGWATVEFDVTRGGDVVNARVISSSDRCFNSPSLRAIRKWKFRSQGAGGMEIAQRGLRKTFSFKITE